ncbi:MAG: hypothetical protein AB7O45_02755 [Alphaproteobacteria bacterium]
MLDVATIGLQLRTQIEEQTEVPEYWCCAPAKKVGERFVEKQVGEIKPAIAMRDFAIRYMQRLNREVAHDGAWVVAWCDVAPRPHPIIVGLTVPIFTNLVTLFKDRDGDVPFVLECDELLRDLLQPGAIDVLVEQADEAWHTTFGIEREAGITAADKIKFAQGERSANPLVPVPNFF